MKVECSKCRLRLTDSLTRESLVGKTHYRILERDARSGNKFRRAVTCGTWRAVLQELGEYDDVEGSEA